MTKEPEAKQTSSEVKALFEAIGKGDVEALDALLSADARLASSCNEQGLSATMWALYNKKPKLAKRIQDSGAQLSTFDLCALGDLEATRSALDAEPELLAANAPDGFMLLHLACFFSHPEIVQHLIERGADVNIPASGAQGIAPLHAATAGGSLSITAKLLDAGALPDATQRGGFTALMSAAAQGNQPMAHSLLRAGASAGLRAEDGRRALDIARSAGHKKLAEFLASK